MQRFSRWITGGIIAALTLGAGGIQATPVMAAGVTQYVDDTAANNGRVRCPNAIITDDLSTLTIVSNEKLIICPGTYKGLLAVSDVYNVRVIGKGNPVIQPAAGQYSIIEVSFSNKVTIQGLTLDGAGLYTITAPTGILYDHSSGTISKNTFKNIVETPTTSDCSGGGAIKLETSTVKILTNTISNFQCYGLFILRSPSTIIQGNKIWSTAGIGSDNTAIYGYASSKLSISKNTIDSDWDQSMVTRTFTGIVLSETTGAKVTNNKISNMAVGVWARARCEVGSASSPDRLQIQGNRLTGALVGVEILVSAHSGITCSPSSNGDVIKGNKFLYPLGGSLPVWVATSDGNLGDSFAPSVSGLVMKSNKYSGAASFYNDNGGPGISVSADSGNKLVTH